MSYAKINYMKNIFFILFGLLLTLSGCWQRQSVTHSESQNSVPCLQSGDLIFVGLPYGFSMEDSVGMAEAIAVATGDSTNYIHVAIAEVSGDSAWVIDATLRHGVDRHPMDTFLHDFTLHDGSFPLFQVMRLRDTTGVQQFLRNAKNRCGNGYNLTFLPGRKEQYCSELVRNSFVTSRGDTLFSQAPMNFLAADGSMPLYWKQLFAQMNMEVPQGQPGTNPNTMSREECLVPIGDLKDLWRKD